MKRFDETKEVTEVTFLLDIDSYSQLENAKLDLQGLSESIKISFLDSDGIS